MPFVTEKEFMLVKNALGKRCTPDNNNYSGIRQHTHYTQTGRSSGHYSPPTFCGLSPPGSSY